MSTARKIMTGFVLSVFLIMYAFSVTYATTVPVTDENLNASLQKFVSSASNDKDYQITVENNVIKIEFKDGECSLNYDLTNAPKFSYEADINQGMSYADFKEKTGNLLNVMIGYLAVTDIQGVNFEDARMYISMALLNTAFSGLDSTDTSNSYIIYDDTEASEGVTFEKNEGSSNIIYASEFGNHAIEYVKSLYNESSSFTDSDALDTFEWTTERKDLTDSSCKLISTLTVKLNSDFSKLQGYSERMTEEFMNKSITEENADYLIKLKVGQQCKIISEEKITGHEISGSSEVAFEEENTVITAKQAGKSNGYFYVGNDNVKKSFYIIVEENKENETLDPITIKISADKSTGENDNKPTAQEPKADKVSTITSDKTITQKILPKTGNIQTIIMIGTILIFSIIAISLGIKNIKFRDIK